MFAFEQNLSEGANICSALTEQQRSTPARAAVPARMIVCVPPTQPAPWEAQRRLVVDSSGIPFPLLATSHLRCKNLASVFFRSVFRPARILACRKLANSGRFPPPGGSLLAAMHQNGKRSSTTGCRSAVSRRDAWSPPLPACCTWTSWVHCSQAVCRHDRIS